MKNTKVLAQVQRVFHIGLDSWDAWDMSRDGKHSTCNPWECEVKQKNSYSSSRLLRDWQRHGVTVELYFRIRWSGRVIGSEKTTVRNPVTTCLRSKSFAVLAGKGFYGKWSRWDQRVNSQRLEKPRWCEFAGDSFRVVGLRRMVEEEECYSIFLRNGSGITYKICNSNIGTEDGFHPPVVKTSFDPRSSHCNNLKG